MKKMMIGVLSALMLAGALCAAGDVTSFTTLHSVAVASESSSPFAIMSPPDCSSGDSTSPSTQF